MDNRWWTLAGARSADLAVQMQVVFDHLARLAAARGAGEAGALGVDCLAGVGALVGHLRVGALQHAESSVPLLGRARLGCNSIDILKLETSFRTTSRLGLGYHKS